MSQQPAMLKSTTGQAMALEGVTARGAVRGLLFELTVEQRYRNPGTTNVEAVYTFPLPFEAVLLDLDVEINGRKLAAVVVEKKEAEGRYEKAIDRGDSAIMLERAGDGLCALNLGNLMAGEAATIRYRYAQLLSYRHGSVRIAVPTVIAPRYGDPAAAGLDPHQVPESDLAVAYPFELSLDLVGDIAAGALDSPSHAIATKRTEEGVLVTLARGACLDRDFVLNVGGLAGRSLAVLARDGEGYVALASFLADVPREASALPFRLKLLVDCSGLDGGRQHGGRPWCAAPHPGLAHAGRPVRVLALRQHGRARDQGAGGGGRGRGAPGLGAPRGAWTRTSAAPRCRWRSAACSHWAAPTMPPTCC